MLVGQPGDAAGKLAALFQPHGVTTRLARTAQDALAMAQSYAPDLILVHWQALDVLGPKFLRMLLDEKLPHTPFVLANAAPFDLTQTDQTDALKAGADHTLPGRLSVETVDAAVALVRRHRHRTAEGEEKLRRVVAKLSDLQERFDSIDNDLMEARKLQQSLMRDRHLDLGATQMSFILRSSGHVGGDLVGHYPINADHTGFFAIDVSGHGVSSALMTARLAGYLSATNPRQNLAICSDGDGWAPRSPAEAVIDLNELVMEDLETDHYFTMLLGYLTPATGRVVLAQAGHPHPVWQRADGSVDYIQVGGLPVGLIPGADYENTELSLSPGDRLVLLSDGFTEATLPDGTFLGEQGLAQLLSASRDQTGTALLETLVWDLHKQIGERDFEDDLSGVAIEFQPSPKT